MKLHICLLPFRHRYVFSPSSAVIVNQSKLAESENGISRVGIAKERGKRKKNEHPFYAPHDTPTHLSFLSFFFHLPAILLFGIYF